MSSSAERSSRARVVRGELAHAARRTEPAVPAGTGLDALALAGRLRGLLGGDLDGLARLETPAELPDPLAAAREEGHAAGYAEGRAAALGELEAGRRRAVAAAAEQLAAAVVAVGRARQDLVEEGAQDAVELTYALARTILGDQLVAASLPPREAVARALRLAPEGRDLLVRVPPSCELTAADLVGLYDTARVSIQADPSVEAGGCVVEAGACRIDAQISTALERVRRVLDERRAGSPEPGIAEVEGA
jgi:flagellar assembly protein FliH